MNVRVVGTVGLNLSGWRSAWGNGERAGLKQFALSSTVIATTALMSAPALAQSSVTLYGVVDDGLMYTSNQGGHSAVQMVQAGMYSTQWGMTGTEDLGGGLKAVFKLEGGVNPNTGASTGFGGAIFGRQTWVGLASPYGTVRLGRQYDPTFDLLGPISATWRFDGGLGAQAGDLNNLFGDTQVTNAIKYLSPEIGGFKAELMYRFGGVPGDFSSQNFFNAAVSYANGPFLLAAGYQRTDSPATAIWNATSAPIEGQTWAANPLASPIFRGYASAGHFQVSGLGASIDVGPGKIGLIYTNSLLQDVVRTSTTPFSGTAVFNEVQASYTAQITPAWLVGTGVNYTWAPEARYTQFLFGARYALSKRTLLYVASAYQHAQGTNSLGQDAVAVLSNVAASNSPNQFGIRIGLHHNF